MEDNEDEPDDVKKATPVADEIKSGSKDEKAGKQKIKGKNKDDGRPSRCDKNAKKPAPAKSDVDCCRSRVTNPTKPSKMMSVLVYSPPCTLPKLEIIPRHCLSKQEYIDVLAAPSKKCPPECLGKTVLRKIRPISARMNELAQPARRLIVSTLQERGEMLPPEMIDTLIKSIEGSACMTPEQAEEYFKDKERKKGGKCGKSKSRKTEKCREKLKNQCPSSLDKEAVMCQYMMAERFVKSILQWRCPIPVEEFQDIASVILRRLGFVLEYTPLDVGQDIKSQQMRFLADIIACWISGVLFEVAAEHKKEIEEELVAAKEDEEEEEEEEEEDEDKAEEDAGPKVPMDEEDEEEEGKGKDENVNEIEIKKEEVGTQANDVGEKSPSNIKVEPEDEADKATKEAEDKLKAEKQAAEEAARLEAEKKKKQEEEEEKARFEAEKNKIKVEEEAMKKEAEEKANKEAEEKKKKEMEEAENAAKLEEEKKRMEAEEEKKRKEQEEEEEKKKQKEAEDKKKREEEEAEAKKKQEEMAKADELKKKQKEEEDKLKEKGPKNAIDKIGEGELFKTDLPFVTFGKILDTLYTMIEDEPEGDETDIIHNRIQRALYEKFAHLIELENPDALTENMKDIVDVLSGKTATWIKKLLKDSEVKFMDTYPPEIESREIRDWGKWIDQVTDRAGDWAEWIHRVVNEAETKSEGNVKRGDWQNWTSDTETNALLWRRYYLETIHQAHHNKMMIADRPVVKTGEKTPFSPIEEEINNTNLEG